MPKHRNRRIVYRALAVMAAGLIMIVSACADDPKSDNSWTQANFWIQDQEANSQHFGRELTVSIGWGIGSGFDHPLIFTFVPEDETERWPEKPGSGLTNSDSDNLVRDLEFTNDMCVGELVLGDCSLVSLSYRLCQSRACEHHTITELTGIVAHNGVVSDITLYWVDPESGGNSAAQTVDLALRTYLERGGVAVDKVEVRVDQRDGREYLDRLSQHLVPAPDGLLAGDQGPADSILAVGEFFAILNELLG